MMHTLNSILLTKQFLESLGVNYYMTSMGYIHKMNSDYPSNDGHGEIVTNNIDIWKQIPTLKIYKDKIFDCNRWLPPVGSFAWTHQDSPYKFVNKQGKTTVDRHPTMQQHSDYVNEVVKPALGLSQNVHPKAQNWIDTVYRIYNTTHGNFDYFVDSINKELDGWGNFYRGF